MNLSCPLDNKDDAIQKVSAVVAGGIASGNFSGFTGGVVNVEGKSGNIGGYSTLTGETSSNLAKLLTPPSKPNQPSNTNIGIIILIFMVSTLVIGFGGGMLLLSLLFFMSRSEGFIGVLLGGGFLFLAILAGVGLFLLIRFIIRKDKEHQKIGWENYLADKSIWEIAMQKWNRLYYCHKHGIVFDPENGEYCEPPSLREFLLKSNGG